MYIIIWKYEVKPEFRDQFLEYYKPEGIWEQLFKRDSNFVGMDFYGTKSEHEFLTIDTWISEESYEKFRRENAARYAEIDKKCEAFTIREHFIGTFHEY